MEVKVILLISGILSILVLPNLTRLLAKAKLTEGLLAMATFKKQTKIYYIETATVPKSKSRRYNSKQTNGPLTKLLL